MLLVLLLTAQAAPDAPSQTIDLLNKPAPSCTAGGTNDIVVCGRRDNNNRYRIAPEYRTTTEKEGLGKAETRIGGTAVSAETEQVDVGGFSSNRIMIRFKVPL